MLSQSEELDSNSNSTVSSKGLHVAIIMDGNGRWANKRGLPRIAGHRAGAHAVRRVTDAARELGVATLTVYAFSSDNWQRPPAEVSALMRLFHRYLRWEMGRCLKDGVRLSVIGRRDRLPKWLVKEIEHAEDVTRHEKRLLLRVALDYSSRDSIVAAARQARMLEELDREQFQSLLSAQNRDQVKDVDLLIRTSGELRLSDFMLWECAYAELYFTPVFWPDFKKEHLAEALNEYYRRDRRYGGVKEEIVPALMSEATANAATLVIGD
ncbi:MAG TPA: di-trans,poly-cis-decaprenylcistransferase [Terriglobales bacterium]|jgi:undecaprenyl diphosphate synthase|nr:di-trans,poly-cis-decaprenylcistransferase [Terriglobales bacterium]